MRGSLLKNENLVIISITLKSFQDMYDFLWWNTKEDILKNAIFFPPYMVNIEVSGYISKTWGKILWLHIWYKDYHMMNIKRLRYYLLVQPTAFFFLRKTSRRIIFFLLLTAVPHMRSWGRCCSHSDCCCLENHFPGTLSIRLKKLFEHNSCEQHKQTASRDITAVCLNS